jgi:hypothetical protein
MFLPCRPCCGVDCFDGCPAKTNTLRLNISAQDYSSCREDTFAIHLVRTRLSLSVAEALLGVAPLT